MTKYLTPSVRRWLYGVTTAALAVLGVYGIIDGQQLAAWSGLAAAITGLAYVNTNEPRDARQPPAQQNEAAPRR